MTAADTYGAGVLGATLFVTLRFALGGVLLPLSPAVRKAWRGRAVWRDGGLLAGFMVGGFLFQMGAIAQLAPAVSALFMLCFLLIMRWRRGV